MTSPNMIEALNKQINAEIFSSYLYLSMSAYYESIGLRGFANWMRIQAQEELQHAMRFYNFIHDRDGEVTLTAIDGPKTEWDSALSAFEDAYAHEKKISSMIHNLVDIAISERDHSANTFLQWFVNEQVEEEATAKEMIDKIKLVDDNKSGLFLIDQDLASRSLGSGASEE